jgi:hypothetical protein
MVFRLPDGGPVRVRTSNTALDTPTPAELEEGEIALNAADGALYYQDSSGAVELAATPEAPGEGGTYARKDGAWTDIGAQVVKASSLAGAGNLHEWFERQYNAYTNTSESGKNKRVSLCLFGDSLVRRMAGWFAYYAAREYDYAGQNGSFGTGAAPVYVGGPNIPLGAGYAISGSVSEVTDGFSIWPNGEYLNVGPGGIVYWPSVTGRAVALWKIAHVAEPGGATFVVEIASSVSGEWSQLGEEIDADAESQIGAIASRESGTNANRFVRIRNTHESASVKIIDAYCGWSTTVRGYDGIGIARGGISPTQAAQALPAIYGPIMESLDPGLIVVHFDDDTAAYENNWDALMAFLRAGNPTRSILFVANGPHSGVSDATNLATRDFLLGKVATDNIAVIDMPSLLSAYAANEAQGWEGDGIHLDPRAYAYVAQLAWRDMSISAPFAVIAGERANIGERLSAPDIRLESRPGSNMYATGVVDDYYLRLVADTTFQQGGRLEVKRDFWVTNQGNTVSLLYLTPNEAVFGNQLPSRFYRPNAANENIPGGYTSVTTGVLEWTAGNKRILRDQATTQVMRLGPYTAEATLDFPEIAAGGQETLTATVTGVATAGKFAVHLGWSAALESGIIVKQAWVSGNNTVSVTLANITDAAINPAELTAYIVAIGVV